LEIRLIKKGDCMLKQFLTPKMFLTVGGEVLVLVGVLGFIGIIGPTPDKSIFGSAWYFDNVENIAHTVLGIVTLALVGLKLGMLSTLVVVLVGVIGLFFGVLNFFLPSEAPNIGGANLESPADLILHLAVGTWALASAWGSMMGMMGKGGNTDKMEKA